MLQVVNVIYLPLIKLFLFSFAVGAQWSVFMSISTIMLVTIPKGTFSFHYSVKCCPLQVIKRNTDREKKSLDSLLQCLILFY